MNRFFCTKDAPIAATKQGKLRGYYFDGVYHFLGITYAKARRFQMPEAPDAWEGVRDAFSYGSICPILLPPNPKDEIVVPHRFWVENENCQNLNLWTPTLDPSAKKPVLVWFHGGGYSNGSALEHVAYEGDNLARKDDVVMICVNHRLNAFGHLDLSSFGEKYANSVNVGIADLAAALQWIKENIASFGGDPENVTIFGQSGGGGKVTTLGQAPAADGLFQKAIIMSGIFWPDRRKDPEVNPRDFVLALLDYFHLDETSVEELEKVPTRLFIRGVNKTARSFELQGYAVNWAPHANEWYAGDPLKVGFREHFLSIPTMVGSTLGEFYAQDSIPGQKDDVPGEERERILCEKYGTENGQKLIDLFRKAYPGKNVLYAMHTDAEVRSASNAYVRLKASQQKEAAPVYSYLFAACFDYDGGRAPWHCADIPFCFHNSERIPYTFASDAREDIEKAISGAFVAFAKTGNPNHAELPHWEPSAQECLNTMVFDNTTEARTNYDDALIEHLAAITPQRGGHRVTPDEDEASGRDWAY